MSPNTDDRSTSTGSSTPTTVLGEDTLFISKPQSVAPTFREWRQSVRIEVAPDSPRTIEQLYEDIFILEELALVNEQGIVSRFGKVACINVFYEIDGVRFRLKEERNRLNPGRTFEEFVGGAEDAVSPSPWRPAQFSLSERMKITGEDPVDAALRALHEELFDTALQSAAPGAFADIDETLRNCLHPLREGPARSCKEPYETGNSYQGIPFICEEHQFEITFGAGRNVPIEVKDGRPQPLYEYIPEEGFVNVYRWEKVHHLRLMQNAIM